MKSFRGLSWLLITCWLFLFGCRPAIPPPALPPELPSVSEEVLLQKLAYNREVFHSLKGLANIRVEFEGKTTRARQVVLIQKPARLRTEILGLFGQPALQVAVHNNQLAVHIPGESLFLQGPATPSNLARFTLLPLGVEDLVRLVLYDVPLMPYIESSVATSAQGYELRLADAQGGAQTLIFDKRIRLVEVVYFRLGQPFLRVVYDNFPAEEAGFPRSTALFMPQRPASLMLDYSELEINASIPSERFVLKAPAGAKVEWLQ